MSKFNTASVRPAVRSPIRSESTPSTHTHEGGAGYLRDLHSELFLLAVSNMVGENTFYEKAGSRDARYEQLVQAAALDDPQWTLEFLRWLRLGANMRSAAVVGAAHFVKARLDLADDKPDDHAKNTSRLVIDAVLQRADEPGEFLAYWQSTFGGKKFPYVVMKGVGDAVNRLYTERALLKWDSPERGWRFGDVIDICHPRPRVDDSLSDDEREWRLARKSALFRYALDRRHGRGDEVPPILSMVAKRAELMAVAPDERRALLDPAALAAAGMTWENLSGWLQDPMDAAAWEAIIPSMGLMALTRNLRNFDQAGVSNTVAEQVAAKLADPEEVKASRQFPFRFLSAYRAVQSLRWGHALEKALSASLLNVPSLRGRTLVVIDRSPSMFPGNYFSTPAKSDISCADQAAVFGCAVAMRAENATVAVYGGTSRTVEVPRGGSLLRFVDGLGGPIDYTDTARAVRSHYAGHDRVLIVTDEQSASADAAASIPAHVPVYVWNLAGYRHGNTPSGGRNRHTFGGLTDHAFRMVPLLESGRDGSWPWVA